MRRMACILSNSLCVRQHRLNLRQRYTERAAIAVSGFERKLTAIGFNSPFRNGKAEAGPAVVTRSRFVDAVKTVEDSRLKFFGNPRTGVTDFQDGVIKYLVHANSDSGRFGTVFDRVVHKV